VVANTVRPRDDELRTNARDTLPLLHDAARASTLVTGYRSDAKAICVLGMHRGGTSAVTGVLHELGAFLGPTGHLMARREDNPAGFYEHQLLTDLNDELLQALGGSWHAPPRLDPGWERAPLLDDIRVRARQRLHEDFADAPLWAWKDPRTSVTLPFWRPLLPETQFVVCVRNPLNVARSLLARDGLDESVGIDLWMRHTVSALSGLETMPLLVLYDELVNDPAREVARIAAFLKLDATPDAVDRARAHLAGNAGLRHHHTTFAEACAAPAVSFAAVALYAVLQRSVVLQRAGALQLEALHDLAGPLAGRAARAHTAERHAESLSSQLAALDARAAGLAEALEARDADIARARGEVGALTRRLDQSTSDHVRLDAMLLEREAEAAARLSARNEEFAALLREREAEAAAQLSTSRAEMAVLRSAHDAEVAALCAARDAEIATLHATHAAEVAAVRAARDVDIATLHRVYASEVAALRTAHEAEFTVLCAARDADIATLHATHAAEVATLHATHAAEVAVLRAGHDAEGAEWQAQAAADAAAKDVLRGEVRRTSAELSAAGTEVGRLHALLLHLQTPTGIVKLALRVVLPAGVHRRLRSWAGREPAGPPEP